MNKSFPLVSRILHWTMAALVLAMLFIGIAMVGSLADYHRLVAIHRPLGILILVLVTIRLVNRIINPPPPLPTEMPSVLQLLARASHILLYALMFALPLIGWGMLSAASYPIVLAGALHLPPILPHSDGLYAALRPLHTVLAFLLFAVFLAHLGAALMHALIFRDGVFASMTFVRKPPVLTKAQDNPKPLITESVASAGSD
jgi:cytochrome b561